MPVSQADAIEEPQKPCCYKDGCMNGCLYWGKGYARHDDCGGAGTGAIYLRIFFCMPCLVFTSLCCPKEVDDIANEMHDLHDAHAGELDD